MRKFILLIMIPLLPSGLNNLYAQSDIWEEKVPIAYDFEQDGIYYKFAPAPDGSYIDTSYNDEEGNTVKDGVYTGLEKEEGNILWVTGKEYRYINIYHEDIRHFYTETYIVNETYIGDIYIPDYVTYEGKTYPVKGISKDAFQYSNNDEKVYTGDEPLYVYSKILSLRLPETLKYLDENAFFTRKPLPITKLPESLRYIGNNALYNIDVFSVKIPDDVLALKVQRLSAKPTDAEKGVFAYPRNAIYAGQVSVSATEVIYPEKMRHLITGDKSSEPTEMVIPDNGEFYIHHYGLPAKISTIYSYAPIMRNCRPGYGFLVNGGYSLGDILVEAKTIYVLPGLKDAYAEEWPELLTGQPYYGYNYKTWGYQKMFFEEDHIIEVSREEMDAMVEAAGLTVPPINTAIDEVQTEPSRKVEEAIYGIDGRRLPKLQKGVNIVRQSDGTTRKVYVRE